MPKTLEQEKRLAIQVTARRTEIERRTVALIHKKIVETFRKIVALGYGEELYAQVFRFSRIKDKDKLEKFLEELRLYLYMIIEMEAQEAVDEVQKHYGFIVPLVIAEFLNRESNGKTPKQRIAIYVNRLKMEMEAWIAAGLALKMAQKALVSAFDGSSNKPYANRVFRAAQATGEAFDATRIRTGGVSYGIGQYVAAENYIKRLARYLVADSFRLAQFLTFGSTDEVIGYLVGRGSSYPCDLCDSMVGFHKKGYGELPPYHANCVCWAMPVRQSDVDKLDIKLS